MPGEKIVVAGSIAFALAVALWTTGAAAQEGGVDPRVESLLRQSCDTLKEAGELKFHADITYDDTLATGETTVRNGTLEAYLQRPDGLRTDYRDDEEQSSFWYDGSRLTLFDPTANLYASSSAPKGIDDLLEFTVSGLGFSIPLSDFLYSDPFGGLLGNVSRGSYLGTETVNGVVCHVLSLSQEDIDWQIWVEQSDRLLPRKLQITYKKQPGSPKYTAVMSGWDFSPFLPQGYFVFEPPAGAARIDFLPPPQQTAAPGRDAK